MYICLHRSTRTRMDDHRKSHIDSEGPNQRNHPKQLKTHNLPNDNVENINRTNKGRDLLLTNKLWIVPWENRKNPEAQQSYFTYINTS